MRPRTHALIEAYFAASENESYKQELLSLKEFADWLLNRRRKVIEHLIELEMEVKA